MQRMIWLALVVAAMATLTWVVGWWTVPVVAAAWAYVRKDDVAAPLLAGLAAMLAWGLLLLIVASAAPGGSVMRSVGAAMQLGPGALLALTIAYGGLLAASSAALVRAIASGRAA
jgi:hypothetical protein